jgi:ParB/RepB/Spo0J family partition protein
MTSGQFISFPVEKVWVDRAKRQRKELTGIEELAESIRENGLIHPPVIKRDGELVVGERRWTAIKSLGWTHLPIQYIDELSEDEFQAVEYEENVRRVDVSWQDKSLAIEHYHQLRTRKDPEWTAAKTAERLGVSDNMISEHRLVAKELTAGNERVAAAPKFSTAKSIVKRKTARAAAAATDRLEENVTGVAPTKVAPIINEDFHVFAGAFTGTPYNLIHCDFPYGVNMQSTDQGGARFEHGSYDDRPDIYWHLLETLRMSMDNVVAPKAHLMFWFSMDFYEATRLKLTEMGWKVNPFPLVWLKSDNTGIIPDANRGPRRIYETAFFASRGDMLVSTPVSNAFSYPGREKAIHMNEKPVPMLKHFMRMFADEYSRVLDPTCGSGNALKAAAALGAPTLLGIEKNPEFYELARDSYFEAPEEGLAL